MEYKFYLSLLGRFTAILASLIPAFILVYLSILNIFDTGIAIAAHGIDLYELFVLLVIVSTVFVTGLVSLHFISLALSPFPSMIVKDTGILYKSIGTIGYEYVGWRGMRLIKRKGLFKYLYMEVMVPEQVKLGQNQNIIYKVAFGFLKTIFWIISFRFFRTANNLRRNKPYSSYNFQIIRIHRLNVGVPLSKIEALLNEKIASYGPEAQDSTAEQIKKYEPTVVRVPPRDFLKTTGKVMSVTTVALVVFTPIFMIGLGAYGYNRDLQNDLTTQQTHALRMLALSGDADAQNKFGWRLSNGLGIPKSNRRANRWYLRAAKQGHTKAQYNVGLSYKCKRKKKSNCEKAAKWFRKAANGGLALAQSKLAYMHYKGWGVKQSSLEAFNLFKAAAVQKDGYSLYFLGFMYEKGRGVEQSRDKAIYYYEEAIKNGYPKAEKALSRLYS